MSEKSTEHLTPLYRNPFDDYNANVLDPEQIVQYWFSPFSYIPLKDFDERKFFSQKMPIVLQGSRGSGKTTILKYFSFPVQKTKAIQNKNSVIKQIEKDGGVGFYLRCDESFLSLFKNVFSLVDQNSWIKYFQHYLELFLSQNILLVLKTIIQESKIAIQNSTFNMLNRLLVDQNIQSLDDLSFYLQSEIIYLNTFSNNVIYTNEKFTSKKTFSFYEISSEIIEIVNQAIPQFGSINYLFLIDEFENLPNEMQRLFNTIVKFSKPRISLRIGRRSENIVTTETINSVEYLRENNDYQLIVLDNLLTRKNAIHELRPYLLGIAQKRLESVKDGTFPTDLLHILGDKEDLDAECAEIVDLRNLHMRYILEANPLIKKNASLQEELIKKLSYPRNPIAEMLNALWVARSTEDDLLKVADTVSETMLAYFSNKDHPMCKKYNNDYMNKYRYALTEILCTAYKKDKAYYGFNAICYLSGGNTRSFINLCRTIINDAMFYERESLLQTGRISKSVQSRAIREFARNEFSSVCSIIQNGESIRKFILSLGNIFSEYHRDREVRYPETNQFVFIESELDDNDRKVINIAESWSLILRKPTPQRLSAGINRQGDIYTINKIFAPLFNISYRTRGGVNIVLSAADISKMLAGQFIESKLEECSSKQSKKKKVNKELTHIQMTLF